MPGNQPSRDADKPAHKPAHKLDNPAAAATEMMWAVALATTRAAVASTARSLELWSHMLSGPMAAPPWSIFPRPFASNQGRAADRAVPPGPSAQGTPAEAAPGEAPAFASYRSSSGHAAAQVSEPH